MADSHASSLFHYTKEIKVLQSILENGFWPNYCQEVLPLKDGDTSIIGIPMISYCDIPITQTSEFRSRYGSFALGMTKDWGFSNGLNPIFYVAQDDIYASLRLYQLYVKMLFDKLKEKGMTQDGNTFKIDLNADLTQMVNFINAHQLNRANHSFIGYSKPYEGIHNGVLQSNYIENEWRYVVGEQKDIQWYWGEAAYKSWRYPEGPKSDKPEVTQALKDQGLKFTLSDISHIIVALESDVVAMAKIIKSLTSLCGQPLSEDDKLLLSTRIISFEQIEKDF